jgi:hypothetical protein
LGAIGSRYAAGASEWREAAPHRPYRPKFARARFSVNKRRKISSSGGTWNGTIFTGDVYRTIGSAWLGVPYDATRFRASRAGSMTIDFEDANRAQMRYTVDGVTQTKTIVRQPF